MEVVMRSLLLFALLAAPVTAQSPSVDQLLHAYAGAGWVITQDQQSERYVCVAEAKSPFVDRVVAILAERARGMKCS